MKALLAIALLSSSLSAFSASVAGKCEATVINSAEKMMSSSDEITDIQAMEENHYVVTYYMYDTCYGSVFVKIAPENDCEVVSVEDSYYPRCH